MTIISENDLQVDSPVLQPYKDSETEFHQVVTLTAIQRSGQGPKKLKAWVLDGRNMALELGKLFPLPETHPCIKLSRYSWSHGYLERPFGQDFPLVELGDKLRDIVSTTEGQTLQTDGQDGGVVWTKSFTTCVSRIVTIDYFIVKDSFLELLSLYEPGVYSRLHNFPSRMEMMENADADPLLWIEMMDVVEGRALEGMVQYPPGRRPICFFDEGLPL